MVEKIAKIIVGLGYGDEGKGLTTDYLCRQSALPIVIRYNGGHQAGHRVVTRTGKSHIFSNFGAGTLRGIPTYWSSFCTFAPTYFLEELEIITIKPKIFVDKACPITTHYDVLFNRAIEKTRGAARLGSCGVGFGATVDREKDCISFLFSDLMDIDGVMGRLHLIRNYYREKFCAETYLDFDLFEHEKEDNIFLNACKLIKTHIENNLVQPVQEAEIFDANAIWKTYIFEGAQGVLLDQNFGNKPYITKSNTTSRNALQILNRYPLMKISKEIYYVSRVYHTRHGAGLFRQDVEGLKKDFDREECNVNNLYQGQFKCGNLDMDLLNYAISKDEIYSKDIRKNMVFTCVDHLETDMVVIYHENKKRYCNYSELTSFINCNYSEVKYSFSSCADDI